MARQPRTMWICPECGHRFVSRNLYHSCGNYRLDDHFRGTDPSRRATFDRLRALVRGIGPATVYAQKTRIVFQGRVRFAGVVVRKRWLQVALWLTRRTDHPLLHKTERYAPNCLAHFLRVTRPEELDAAFVSMLRDAYAIGQQEHQFPR